jgi:hypothetical protein
MLPIKATCFIRGKAILLYVNLDFVDKNRVIFSSKATQCMVWHEGSGYEEASTDVSPDELLYAAAGDNCIVFQNRYRKCFGRR